MLSAALLAAAVTIVGLLSLWLWFKPMPAASNPKAVVVLGGGVSVVKTQGKAHVVSSPYSTARAKTAAHYAQTHGLPLVMSGAEAPLMLKALHELNLPLPKEVYLEAKSRTTCENARFSQQILAGLGADQVVLVSDAFHLPRAAQDFADYGVRTLGLAAPLPSSQPKKTFVSLYRTGYETAAMLRNFVLRQAKKMGHSLPACTAPRNKQINQIAKEHGAESSSES